MKTNKIFTKKNFITEKLYSIKTSFYKGKNKLKVFALSKLKSIFDIRNILKIPLILTASAFFIQSQNQKNLYQDTDIKKLYLSKNQRKLEDLQNGELEEFTFGETEKIKILIIKKNGKLYAFNNECPYQGNPLHKGILIHNKIKCPLHGDTFDLFTGENLIGPSIDDLKKYKLKLDENSQNENKYYIEVESIKTNKGKNKVYKRETQDNNKFIIIGGGISALSCAKTLRESGFKGEINIISEEKFLPYNRPAISKAIQIDNNKILLKDDSFFRDYDINIQLNTEVAFINEVTKEIKLSNGNVKVNIKSI